MLHKQKSFIPIKDPALGTELITSGVTSWLETYFSSSLLNRKISSGIINKVEYSEEQVR